MSTARWIDAVVGVLFVIFGIWGLVSTNGLAFWVFPVNVALAAIAIIAGVALLYGTVSTPTAKSVAGTVGLLLGLAGVIGLFSQGLFGLIPASAWNIGLLLVSAALLLYDWLVVSPDVTDGSAVLR